MNLNSKIIKFENTEKNDIWNFPIAQRKDTMFLSTIKDKDIGFNKYKSTPHILNLTTYDINKKKILPTTRKNNSLITKDIKNCKSKKHFRLLKMPFDRFSNKDIKGNKSQIIKFQTKRSPSNPLTPIYKLPKLLPFEKISLKFIKDPLKIDDIKGTKSENIIKDQFIKKTNFIGDIKIGKILRRKKRQKEKLLKFENKNCFRSSRNSNPLEPSYLYINKKTNEKIKIGKIEKNFPKILHRNLNKKNDSSLNTKDIEGAQASTSINLFSKKKVI